MFTGIIEKFARVSSVCDRTGFRRLTLALGWPDLQLGQSIAVNGCCLTVVELSPHEVAFDIIKESLEKTNLGLLNPGDEVNIERSLRVGDRIDGHFVQGHVDGRAILRAVVATPQESRLSIEAPPDLAKFIVPKGSVAIDGVSLTVASLKANQFEVALIPTTLGLTTLGKKQPGWPFNLETDILSKTIVSWLENQRGTP